MIVNLTLKHIPFRELFVKLGGHIMSKKLLEVPINRLLR